MLLTRNFCLQKGICALFPFHCTASSLFPTNRNHGGALLRDELEQKRQLLAGHVRAVQWWDTTAALAFANCGCWHCQQVCAGIWPPKFTIRLWFYKFSRFVLWSPHSTLRGVYSIWEPLAITCLFLDPFFPSFFVTLPYLFLALIFICLHCCTSSSKKSQPIAYGFIMHSLHS